MKVILSGYQNEKVKNDLGTLKSLQIKPDQPVLLTPLSPAHAPLR